MARPKKQIDGKLVASLAEIGCSGREIAIVCECNEKTLRNRFGDEIARGKEVGKIALRRKQWAVAKRGSIAMLIWLGKQWLGQKDKQEVEMTEPQPVSPADLERYRDTIRSEPGYVEFLRAQAMEQPKVKEQGNGNGNGNDPRGLFL